MKCFNHWQRSLIFGAALLIYCIFGITSAAASEEKVDSTKAPKGSVERAPATIDGDEDGLESSLEVELGTNPNNADTDGDGLSDYDEHCKYRTDPTRRDTDGDGKPDGEWDERREYAYTICAVCEIRPPNDAELMNDLYQDIRVLRAPGRFEDSLIVEILLFPFSTPHVFAQPYPRVSIPAPLKQYTERTLGMNFSEEMQREVKKIVENAKTDVEVVEAILAWIANETKLDNRHAEFAYFTVVDNKIVWNKSLGSEERNERLLHTNFFGDSMFKNRVHGTCSSTATLRGTMLRAAGIPTRIIQNLPLISRYMEDPEPLVDKMRDRMLAKGYELNVHGGGGANHIYNEVFLNNHWIRVDGVINPGPFVGDKLFVKVYSLASWNDRVDWQKPRPDGDSRPENRDYRALEVSDAFPKYKYKVTEAVDIAIEDSGLSVQQKSDSIFTATIRIRNKGSAPSPQFGVNFYAGYPGKRERLLAEHLAGPIMPGGSWGEHNSRLSLEPEESMIVVVVDPDKKVPESNEENNRATRVIPQRLSNTSGVLERPEAHSLRYSVRVVVGKEKMSFQGKEITWEELPALLEQVPNRRQTVLEIAVESEDIESREDWGEIRNRLASLSYEFGFEYPSIIGVHPMGEKGSPPSSVSDREG